MPDTDSTAPALSALSPSSPEIFTVFARDTPFRLTRSQIETDSPNYLTSAFLSHDFSESITREIHTDKHPQLFALIVEHLSGYTFLPLEVRGLPSWMSEEAALENLLRDAKYFGLERLQELLATPELDPSLPQSVVSILKDRGTTIYPLERVCEGGDLAFDVKVHGDKKDERNPLPLTSGPSGALFLVRDAELALNLFSDGGANGGESLELNTGDSILSQKYGRVRSSNGGLVDLHWSSVVHPDDRERTFFKLTKEFLDFDTLDRSIGWDAHERMYESDPSIAYRTLKYPLPCPDEYSLPTLGVIAETLVISICAHRENDGIYTSASASLVYAEFKTIDEWTKTCLAPAVAAFRK